MAHPMQVANSRRLARLLPGAHLVEFEGCGHMPHVSSWGEREQGAWAPVGWRWGRHRIQRPVLAAVMPLLALAGLPASASHRGLLL